MKGFKRFCNNYYRKLIFALSASDSFIYSGFYKYFYKPSAASMSAFISEYSKTIKDFTVVQIGANDGITNDPIHKFIIRDDWKGVLLEPQKFVFERFLVKLYYRRKKISVVNAAFGPKDGVLPLYKIGFSNARWATGLASFNKSIVELAFTSGHVQRRAQKDGIAVPADKELQITSENVPVLCTATLLQRYPIKKIDLLQIDAEGYDHEIIKMFDFNLIIPGAVIFEHTHIPDAELASCHAYLSSLGYTMRVFDGNTIAGRA